MKKKNQEIAASSSMGDMGLLHMIRRMIITIHHLHIIIIMILNHPQSFGNHFDCDNCGEVLSEFQAYRAHREDHKVSKEKETVNCQNCNLEMQRASSRRHLADVHNIEIIIDAKKIVCKPKIFFSLGLTLVLPKPRQTPQSHHHQLQYLSELHHFPKSSDITRIIKTSFFSFSSSPVSSDSFSYTYSKYSNFS